MPRTLSIVAAGEALLADAEPQPALAGLALRGAAQAIRCGHKGIAVSRVGQDEAGRTLLELARERGIHVDHVQHDPDLPTGRLWRQGIGASAALTMDARAAFDNLQWDHDLIDLAMRTHVCLTGALVRRSGQSRAEIDRFVAECRTAIKVFDLVNRDDAHFERSDQLAMLGHATGVVIDRRAADEIVPAQRGASITDAGRAMLREFKLQFVLALDPSGLHLMTKDSHASGAWPGESEGERELVVVAALHFLAHGCDEQTTVERTAAVVGHALRERDQPIPARLLEVS